MLFCKSKQQYWGLFSETEDETERSRSPFHLLTGKGQKSHLGKAADGTGQWSPPIIVNLSFIMVRPGPGMWSACDTASMGRGQYGTRRDPTLGGRASFSFLRTNLPSRSSLFQFS